MEIWEPKPPGTLWATPGLLRDSSSFTFDLRPLSQGHNYGLNQAPGVSGVARQVRKDRKPKF